MANERLQQALGGAPGKVVLKLVLASLLVGVVLAALEMTPWGLIHYLRYLFHEIVGSGMEAVHRVLGYAVSGAVIVLPIWLLIRLFSARKAQ